MAQEKPKRIIKLGIKGRDEREKLIIILANNGYAVWIEVKKVCICGNSGNKYFVCFYEEG